MLTGPKKCADKTAVNVEKGQKSHCHEEKNNGDGEVKLGLLTNTRTQSIEQRGSVEKVKVTFLITFFFPQITQEGTTLA